MNKKETNRKIYIAPLIYQQEAKLSLG